MGIMRHIARLPESSSFGQPMFEQTDPAWKVIDKSFKHVESKRKSFCKSSAESHPGTQLSLRIKVKPYANIKGQSLSRQHIPQGGGEMIYMLACMTYIPAHMQSYPEGLEIYSEVIESLNLWSIEYLFT